MTTPARIALALAACDGMTDADLQQRGPAAFAAMIQRKRKYSAVSRLLVVDLAATQKLLNATTEQLKQAVDNLQQLEALDAPVTDTTEAASMLAAFNKKGAE